jgi:pimeloyl-ACP methyl ester carboxylesterase
MTAQPALGAVEFALRDVSRPLLVLGPSLGTSVSALWSDAAGLLIGDVDVVGWDLPGHGTSPPPGAEDLAGLTVGDLASAVLGVVQRAVLVRGCVGRRGGGPAAAAGRARPGAGRGTDLHRAEVR